jgi:hypothetical protein
MTHTILTAAALAFALLSASPLYAAIPADIQEAAEQGDATTQADLGWRYGTGEGVKQDDVEAIKWYRKAADQGDANAQFNLGVMYYDGKGVKQDNAEAIKWFQKAADQGDTDALALLQKLKQ